jgi:hypothetical protein
MDTQETKWAGKDSRSGQTHRMRPGPVLNKTTPRSTALGHDPDLAGEEQRQCRPEERGSQGELERAGDAQGRPAGGRASCDDEPLTSSE